MKSTTTRAAAESAKYAGYAHAAFLGALSLTLGAIATRAPARAQAPTLRVVVHAPSALDRAVAARLEGQVSDLDVRLLVTRSAHPLERDPTPTGPAFWFATEGGRFMLHADPLTQPSVLLARLPLSAAGDLDSGGLETAALVMRTAIQALLRGQPVPEAAAEGIGTTDAPSPPGTAVAPRANRRCPRCKRQPTTPTRVQTGQARKSSTWKRRTGPGLRAERQRRRSYSCLWARTCASMAPARSGESAA